MCVYVYLECGRVAEAAAPARAGTVAVQLPIGLLRAETAARPGHRPPRPRRNHANLKR